tara:strand:+ start:193 stop:624 length:432 start_codon:yes stop_codon:yes gene_type:complete
MPAPSYVDGAAGMTKGVANDEVGIKVSSVDTDIADPKEYSFDKHGGHDGFCHGYNPSITLSITGEVATTTSSNPIYEAAFGAAFSFANKDNAILVDSDGNGSADKYAGIATTGGFYPETISFNETRDGFKTMSITAISHPAIT